MHAHIIENGTVVNTIVVESLDVFPNLIDASNGGAIGDDWDGQAFSTPAVVPVVPQSVSPLQARKALKQQSLLATVQAAVNGADEGTQMAWEYATSFDRQSPFVLGMASVFGWTNDDLDTLFILAATL